MGSVCVRTVHRESEGGRTTDKIRERWKRKMVAAMGGGGWQKGKGQNELLLVWEQEPCETKVGDVTHGKKNNAPWQNSTLCQHDQWFPPKQSDVEREQHLWHQLPPQGNINNYSHLLKNALASITLPIKWVEVNIFIKYNISVTVRACYWCHSLRSLFMFEQDPFPLTDESCLLQHTVNICCCSDHTLVNNVNWF